MKFHRDQIVQKLLRTLQGDQKTLKWIKVVRVMYICICTLILKNQQQKTGTFVRFKQIIKAECSNFMTRLILKVKYS